MARLKPAEPRGLDPVRRITAAFSRRQYGRELAPAEIIAHHRGLLTGYGALGVAFDRYATAVDRRLKELAMLRSAQLAGCEWCLDFGSKLARDCGVPEEQLRELAVWRDSDRFDERERVVLAYTEGMTRTPVEVDDELFDRLRRHFDERQIVELTIAIGFENLNSRMNWALGIGSQGFAEGVYCVRPQSAAGTIAEAPAAR